MINAALLAKFKRRAPHISTQGHLDKVMRAFPVELHDDIAAHVQPLLKGGLTARKVESVPELKPKDPENPTLQERTAQRLNAKDESARILTAQVESIRAERDALQARVTALGGTNMQMAGLHAELATVKAERDQLRAKLQDAGLKL